MHCVRVQPSVVLSGSDDCCMKVHDVSAGETAITMHTDKRAHGAGVCTLSAHPTIPHLLASGSYDESVRLWDLRNVSRPVCQAQVRACISMRECVSV